MGEPAAMPPGRAPGPAGPAPAGSAPAGSAAGGFGRPADLATLTTSERGGDAPDETPDGEPVMFVPVRRIPSIAVAGFAMLLGIGLVFGGQTTGPDVRIPFAIVIFGVQLLYVAAWLAALRPPAPVLVGAVCVAVAGTASAAAILPDIAALAPLGYTAAGGFVVSVLAQLIRSGDRARVTDSLGATLLVVVGVVALSTLIVLSRRPLGTQAILVCLAATAIALAVARLTDAVLPGPRLAPQVPRGAAGVVAGAMVGTLASAVIGRYLVGFSPTSAAVVGLVAGAAAVLADLAVGYLEAGRQMAGERPTFWAARYAQGPLGGFALAAPVAYAVAVFFL